MVTIKNLQKYYGKGKKNTQHVLKDISLTLPEKGLVCILGESGSGKTTLLNAIGALDDFSSGSIMVDDVELMGYQLKKIEPLRNEQFGYVFQNYYLLMDKTVKENVKIVLNQYEISEEEKEARAAYVLKMLNMERYQNKLVDKLSGGQRQRVSIARALVKAPKIILADEPTGNLDEENTLKTMSILKNVSKECLVLLVSHERRIAEFFADRIIEIADGKIKRDELRGNDGSYERVADANIYLGEMELKTLSNDFAAFNLYYQKSLPKITLNLAFRDGKLYIQNQTQGVDLVLEGAGTGVEMLAGNAPTVDMDAVEKMDFHLDRLTAKKRPDLSFGQIFKMAVENVKNLRRRQVFMMIILFFTAILLTVTGMEYYQTISANEDSFVETDANYLKVDFTKRTSIRAKEDQLEILSYLWEHMDSMEEGEAFYVPDAGLYLKGFGYIQANQLLQRIKGYSYANINRLTESDIIYGSLPSCRNEIVVDKKVIQKLMKSHGVVSGLYDKEESYVGAKLTVATTQEDLRICGISDTEESNIYCSQNLLIGLGTKGYRLASDTEEREVLVEGGYEGTKELEAGEILYREGLYQAHFGSSFSADSQTRQITIGDDETHPYQVVGTFSDDIGVDYILSEADCRNVLDLMIYETKSCYVYSKDLAACKEALEKAAEGYKTAFVLEVVRPYDEERAAFLEAHQVNFEAKNMIMIAVLIVALLFIYFTMKSNVILRSEELTVYRLIGTPRRSIEKEYVLEMMLLTTMTSLPAVLLSAGVLALVTKIPSLEMNYRVPWGMVWLFILAIYAIHAMISFLPVHRLLAKPPAALAMKD